MFSSKHDFKANLELWYGHRLSREHGYNLSWIHFWNSSSIQIITLICTLKPKALCVGPTNLDVLVFQCSLLSPYTFSTNIVGHMSFICNLEHSV